MITYNDFEKKCFNLLSLYLREEIKANNISNVLKNKSKKNIVLLILNNNKNLANNISSGGFNFAWYNFQKKYMTISKKDNNDPSIYLTLSYLENKKIDTLINELTDKSVEKDVVYLNKQTLLINELITLKLYVEIFVNKFKIKGDEDAQEK